MIGYGSIGESSVGSSSSYSPIQNDSEAPIIPGVLSISNVDTAGFTVAWGAAVDNVGVTGYEVSVDTGTPVYVDVGVVLSTAVTGKAPSTTYTVRVRAYDAANLKSTSLTTQATTATPIDAAEPIWGQGSVVVVSAVTASSLTATWPAASDNIGVVSYEVSVDTGVAKYSNVGTTRTRFVTNLDAGTTYTVRVRAVDATGNVSQPLTLTTATTGNAPVGPAAATAGKLSESPVVYELSPLSSAPAQINFKSGTGQELVLFNNGTSAAVVTLKGSTAGAVTTKGLAGVTVDLSGGLPITVPAKEFVTLKLENAVLYLRGACTLTTNGSAVFAGILQ